MTSAACIISTVCMTDLTYRARITSTACIIDLTYTACIIDTIRMTDMASVASGSLERFSCDVFLIVPSFLSALLPCLPLAAALVVQWTKESRDVLCIVLGVQGTELGGEREAPDPGLCCWGDVGRFSHPIAPGFSMKFLFWHLCLVIPLPILREYPPKWCQTIIPPHVLLDLFETVVLWLKRMVLLKSYGSHTKSHKHNSFFALQVDKL